MTEVRISPRTGVAFPLNKGQRLTVIDPEGTQVSPEPLHTVHAADASDGVYAHALDFFGRVIAIKAPNSAIATRRPKPAV